MDQDEAEFEERLRRVQAARAAIVAAAGPWKRGDPAVVGEIDCPVCGKQRTLRFSRAGRNGHIHARCQTAGCVSWME